MQLCQTIQQLMQLCQTIQQLMQLCDTATANDKDTCDVFSSVICFLSVIMYVPFLGMKGTVDIPALRSIKPDKKKHVLAFGGICCEHNINTTGIE